MAREGIDPKRSDGPRRKPEQSEGNPRARKAAQLGTLYGAYG